MEIKVGVTNADGRLVWDKSRLTALPWPTLLHFSWGQDDCLGGYAEALIETARDMSRKPKP